MMVMTDNLTTVDVVEQILDLGFSPEQIEQALEQYREQL